MPTPLPKRPKYDPLDGLVTRVHPAPAPVDVVMRQVGTPRPSRPRTAAGWIERLQLDPLLRAGGRT
ncbi:hypothetical protein ACFWGN_16275 [Oerskovia sp. NPDC060338]|uniref:hypothetical protein n=1 Tax=Oerskovia sp. NPDC060338 TaxID=3347100 RepID=UPI00364B5142